jgi:sugar transferase (PEP-CTERM/EpsH1 system associated)
MNVLFLSHRIPFPPNKGEKIRAYNFISHLTKSHVVHLAAFVDDPADIRHAQTLHEMVRGETLFVPLRRATVLARAGRALVSGRPLTTSYFGGKELDRWIADVLRRYAIGRVFLFSSAMAPFFLKRPRFDPARVILDMVDVDSDKWRQYSESSDVLRSWIFRREARKLFALERRAAAAFGATLFVSPYEARTFVDMAPETRDRVYSIPNGVNFEYFRPGEPHANPYGPIELPVVMTGTMDYWPNVQGAVWFIKKVLPIVRRALPQARFHVVGAKPTAELKALAGLGVDVTGAVEDVRPFLEHAAAVVAPLHLARGVQNKVLEAMAMQKPVVATLAASRGLSAVAGTDLWVADEPAVFAQAVIEALCGAERERIAANGRRLVERDYDWKCSMEALDRMLMNQPLRTVGVRGHSDNWSAAELPLGGAVE